MICNNCGSDIPDHSKFCLECGAPQRANGPSGTDTTSGNAELDKIEEQGEYRHITVMFVDLVGSTRLSEQLSPEAYRRLILRYNQICIDPIGRYGGFVARYLGDGILVYFGYPNSYEDNAARACHAAIEIHRNLKDKGGETFRESGVRIGIHSGRVLTGGSERSALQEDNAIFGRTPNLAARLQAEAEVNQTIISHETHQLLDGGFDASTLGQRNLKGIEAAIDLYQLKGIKGHRTGSARQTQVHLVDRGHEQRRLMDVWKELHRFNVVTVTDQSGIGKSALLDWFLATMPDPKQSILVMTCSPYDERSPFAPLARALDHLSGTDLVQNPADRPASYDTYFDEIGLEDRDARASLKFIAGIEDTWIARAFSANPEELRSQIARGLERLLFVLSNRHPLLVVFENAQWADPSSIETLHRLTISLSDQPILLAIVARGAASALTIGRNVQSNAFTLEPLSRNGVMDVIRTQDADGILSSDDLSHIADRSDGIPLFVRELTRSTLERRKSISDSGTSTDAVADDLTPYTLADALTARMENVGSGWVLAQTASVIGRRFTLDGLVALTGNPGEAILDDINRMIAADVIVPEENALEAVYQFRLTLLQSIAYESMLTVRRRELHDRYLRYVETLDDPYHLERPERLAYHAKAADRHQDAADYLKLAGEWAAARSSLSEAVDFFRDALKTLSSCAETVQRDRLELSILVRLGGSLVNLEGAGAPETVAVYDQAVHLCERLGPTADHVAAYWGWWFTATRLEEMEVRSNTVVAIANATETDTFRMQAHHCAWGTTFQLGHHAACLDHIKQGLALYETVEQEDQARLFGGHDTAVCGLGEAALAHWLMGDVGKSNRAVQQALARADQLQHIGSRTHAMDYALAHAYYTRDLASLDRQLDSAKEFVDRFHLSDVSGKLQIYNGWSAVSKNLPEEGLKLIRSGMSVMRERGGFEDFPIYISMEAETLLALGRVSEMRALLYEGDEIEAALAFKYWAPEIYRLRAIANTQTGNLKMAERNYDEALELANSQGANMLALRVLANRYGSHADRPSHPSERAILEDALNTVDLTESSFDVVRARKILETTVS